MGRNWCFESFFPSMLIVACPVGYTPFFYADAALLWCLVCVAEIASGLASCVSCVSAAALLCMSRAVLLGGFLGRF